MQCNASMVGLLYGKVCSNGPSHPVELQEVPFTPLVGEPLDV